MFSLLRHLFFHDPLCTQISWIGYFVHTECGGACRHAIRRFCYVKYSVNVWRYILSNVVHFSKDAMPMGRWWHVGRSTLWVWTPVYRCQTAGVGFQRLAEAGHMQMVWTQENSSSVLLLLVGTWTLAITFSIDVLVKVLQLTYFIPFLESELWKGDWKTCFCCFIVSLNNFC